MASEWGMRPESGRQTALALCVTADRPLVCAACGRRSDEAHPFGCGVLVRLCAQYLFVCDRSGWRDVALRLVPDDPHCPEADHWRAVAEEPDPPAVDVLHTPVPVRAGDGMDELADPVGMSHHGAARALHSTVTAIRTLLPGATVCPVPFEVPDADDPAPVHQER